MSVLSADDIAGLRQAVSDLFPDRADIYGRTEQRSEYGGDVSTYALKEQDVPVLFGARSARALTEQMLASDEIDQMLTFPGGTDIQLTDQVVTKVDGQRWEVVSVGGGGSWEVTLPVAVKRVDA